MPGGKLPKEERLTPPIRPGLEPCGLTVADTQVATNAKWLPRTIVEVRGDRGHGYRPDVDSGVRVDVTPLVEQRLLPRVVLKRLGG